ncbi:hypothetical protein FHU38_003549 [Saccharomonospora amisosensis]|uniref:Uncharacterized protein n=1 Tax=Saccharomonospora amisosensis TaxID=1128677 RepID=A0A7X5US59_9PSEU|nr:hypothetical protein [Saccharomonospora amisosensis]NIJ13205.1 hypothetical protein [Saccharomonospora amisosensis]
MRDSDDVPAHVRDAVRRVTDEMDELRTRRIRFRDTAAEHAAKRDRPEPPEPAEALREAALRRDAPVELVRLARAVREGRTSWQAIVSGDAGSLPEFIALRTRARNGINRILAEGLLHRGDLPERSQSADPPGHEHGCAGDDEGDLFTSVYDRRP